MKTVSGHGIVPYGNLQTFDPNLRFFTFLRDPIVRCASDYQFRVRRGSLQTGFREWIETDVARNQQVKKIAGCENADAAIEMVRDKLGFVGLVERFDDSLVLWKKWSYEPQLDIRYRPKNVASDSSLKKQLLADPKSRQQLQEANHEDEKLYRFVVDEVFPRQIEQYGPSFASDKQQFEAPKDPLAVYPRQFFSMLLRELIYKPLVPILHDKTNPPLPHRRRAA